MEIKPLVSILILNYNGENILKDCLLSIREQSYKNIEIIVVDNNSSDNSKEVVRKFKEVIWLKNKKNYGYSKGNNIGVEKASGSLIFILNNDTVLDKKCISNLVNCHKPQTIISPEQCVPVYKKGGIEKTYFCGMGMDVFGYPYQHRDLSKTKLFYVDGAALFMSKKDFIDLGMLDEEHFLFFEDIDLSWRAQIFGYTLLRCPEAKLLHLSGTTAEGAAKKTKQYKTTYLRRYLNEKNLIRNILKNYSFPLCCIILPSIFLMHIPEMLILSLLGRSKAAKCYLQAYNWNIKNIKNTLKERKRIQSKRKISDWQLLKRMHFVYPKIGILLEYGIPSFS